MIFAGVDVGSISTETVILDKDCNILTYNIFCTGFNSKLAAEKSLGAALKKINMSFNDVAKLITTGYGRKIVTFKADSVSEISCHAKGAHFLFPNTRTVIDIGGQDSKAVRINEEGDSEDFNMNDKCAAGTGRFLEVMATALGVKVDKLGKLSLQAKKRLVISSMCTVFAESEVVSLLAEGLAREDIAKGLHNAIADRVLSLAYKVRMTDEVTLTGGVAKNIGVVDAIKIRLNGMTINVSEEPQIVGALGAALIARDSTT